MRGSERATMEARLDLHLPFDAQSLFGHLLATAVPGCEEHRDGWYRSTVRLAGGFGIVALRPEVDHVVCHLELDDPDDADEALARCRRLLDLDRDPGPVMEALGGDEVLGPWVAAVPGRRIPTVLDPAAMAVRIVLSQQVSLAAARTHNRRLAEHLGTPITDPGGGLHLVFPSVEELAAADPLAIPHEVLAIPAARRRCLGALVEAIVDETVDLSDWDRARGALGSLPGIGPWTTEMIAMRALGRPDALPASDIGVLRGAEMVGLERSAAVVEAMAERWRPWRSYAVQYLWASVGGPVNRWPPEP